MANGFGKVVSTKMRSATPKAIRDWNLRAVYGAFNAMKNRDGADKHQTAILTWVAFIGGPRESRRLMGDVVLTEEDIVAKRDFPDGCVPSTWSIDLHYPKEQYAEKFPDNPFISKAVHGKGVDRSYGYPVPYRCFYSRNIDNLFMAGRCISVTHEALGTVRVMKTCGMMGEVVGKAASICAKEDCSPRDVYEDHLDELLELLKLPGKARRSTPSAPVIISPGCVAIGRFARPAQWIGSAKLDGIVVDDRQAKLAGSWQSGTRSEELRRLQLPIRRPHKRCQSDLQTERQAGGQIQGSTVQSSARESFDQHRGDGQRWREHEDFASQSASQIPR